MKENKTKEIEKKKKENMNQIEKEIFLGNEMRKVEKKNKLNEFKIEKL